MSARSADTRFADLVQEFFLERLVNQRNASSQTIAAYRDSFRLLLDFVKRRLGMTPERMTLADLGPSTILAFLDHLERERHNTIRSRNARLAAIRSFLHFVAFKEPTALPLVQRVLAIPMKRFDKPLLGFVSREEMQAILEAPDGQRWSGHRDRTMFATLYNAGARVSEITAVRVGDIMLAGTGSVHLHGKGRRDRTVPLWRTTAAQIRRWLPRINREPDHFLFPNASGARMTRAAVAARLRLAVARAALQCPSLRKRRVSPHTFRHSTAMHMLQAGVDITLIALWLGHESPTTTHIYVEADLEMKERALKVVQPPEIKRTRYRPPDRLLHFLQTL